MWCDYLSRRVHHLHITFSLYILYKTHKDDDDDDDEIEVNVLHIFVRRRTLERKRKEKKIANTQKMSKENKTNSISTVIAIHSGLLMIARVLDMSADIVITTATVARSSQHHRALHW